MPVITEREETLSVLEEFRQKGASMAVFCTASPWNTEAILLALKRFGQRHGIPSPAASIGITFNYPNMPQAQRVTRSRDAVTGFRAIWAHLRELCGRSDSPYAGVRALPHLDHAHPVRDAWALTEGLEHLASVMFDAQELPLDENRRLTARYVRDFGDRVVVEGNFEGLGVAVGAVHGMKAAVTSEDEYADRVAEYVRATGVDLMVADLGTEQQATTVGDVRYLKDRAQAISARLGSPSLVLHGGSSLSMNDFAGLAEDGVIRVNMWTRIAREAAQFATERLVTRLDAARAGNFEALDTKAFLDDATEKGAEVMEEALDLFGYRKMA